MEPFRPLASLIAGSHMQTIGGQLVRSFLRWPFDTEDVVVEAADDVRLLLRATWQKDEAGSPTLLLIHGLEGSDRARYLISTGTLAFRSGWNVVRMNMRGCGDSMVLCPQLYNAGLTSDLVAVCRWLASRTSRLCVGGFSLGAGLTLLSLAREKHRLPDELVGAVAVCPPLDMSRCADALELSGNWVYQNRFTQSLNRSYRERQRLAPKRYEAGRERRVRTLRQFDDVITAFYGGYDGAEHYYRTVSAGPRLGEIDRPALVLLSENDPFIPCDSVSGWPRSEHVAIEAAVGAGHVGFIGRSRAPRFFWAADRIVEFLQRAMKH